MSEMNEHINMLVDKYGDMILRLSYTYLKNAADAEDTVQDVFLKIIEKSPCFNDDSHEKAWIIRTTINTCKNRLKMFRNRKVDSIDDINEIAIYDKYCEDSDVLKAVMSLSEKYIKAMNKITLSEEMKNSIIKNTSEAANKKTGLISDLNT